MSPLKINEVFVDCVSKYLSFLCPKCKKSFKKVIACEIESTYIDMELTFNRPDLTH